MGYLFRIILEYKNGFLTKKIRFFDKNFERLQGADRIIITMLVIVFLFTNKNIRHMLKEIFQPQCQITTEHIQKSSKDAKKKENKKKDTKKRR